MNNTITLAMIVKNEAANLAACLESAKDQVDEVVIVDTGSTDNTLEIAGRYTDKIYTYPWQGDFSAARNYALARSSGQWILSLDADERLFCEPGQLRKTVEKDEQIEAYLLPLDYPVNESTGEYNRFMVLRLFKNTKDHYFAGRIHEQVIIHKNEAVGFAEDIIIKHQTVSQKERNRKRGRNLKALKEACAADPQNFFLQYYLGVEWLGLGKPARAQPYLESAYRNLTDNHLHFRMPALRYLSTCLNALGKFDEAICLGQEAALRYPDYTDIYYLTGIALEEKAEYKLAVKWFEEAVKCGVPPVLYTHMQGAGSFLAYFHMGYCWENMGRPDIAKACYEQALDANNRYYYPVTSLFLLMLAHHGPRSAFAYFEKKGYLSDSPLALCIAELFFTYGYPGLAKKCLTGSEVSRHVTDEILYHLGRYRIYAGDFQEGLISLERIPPDSQFSNMAVTHRSMALLLTGCVKECRNLALAMWKNKQLRPTARALLRICRFMLQNGVTASGRQGSQEEMVQCFLDLLNLCHHYLPDRPGDEVKNLKQVTSILERILSTSSKGIQKLDRFYQDKVNLVEELFKYKFGAGGVGV
ncbi:glycosyltransferase [Desulforamulus putei]|uniref:TPR repeat-containing protein n=1 Tax=Desulforamulus putei DSM 12395 TaxID=1121429 RepID=A0A1M4S935_9FIRM|nr:TPR domain-containing glycosyltransferase [Desulforamulus putei]SHE28678.1 TPR repeat-containing protein [Desulforamulus putei DSM 12395]